MAAGRAVVLLSGGLDSAVCLGWALSRGLEPHPLTIRYEQRHSVEVERARAIAAFCGIPAERHRVIDLGRAFTGSALTGDAEVPEGRPPEAQAGAIPATYVPARNAVFLALAAGHAEAVGARDIVIGVNAVDYSGYPDCRPEFIEAFRHMINLGTRAGAEGRPFRIATPLARLSKAEIVRLGHALGVPFHLTHSCYRGRVPACGACDACLLRRKGFREAGIPDPVPYEGDPA